MGGTPLLFYEHVSKPLCRILLRGRMTMPLSPIKAWGGGVRIDTSSEPQGFFGGWVHCDSNHIFVALFRAVVLCTCRGFLLVVCTSWRAVCPCCICFFFHALCGNTSARRPNQPPTVSKEELLGDEVLLCSGQNIVTMAGGASHSRFLRQFLAKLAKKSLKQLGR